MPAFVILEHMANGLFAGAMALSPLGVALIGVAIERLAIRRFYKEDPALALLFTFGLAMAAEQSLRLIWGATGLPFAIPEALRGQVFLGDFIYSRYRIAVLAVSAAAVSGCWLLLNKTAFGPVVRAGPRGPELVRGRPVLFYPPAAEASRYALMVLVLLVRPRGLMGERFERFE